jgi:hypothetical protein
MMKRTKKLTRHTQKHFEKGVYAYPPCLDQMEHPPQMKKIEG